MYTPAIILELLRYLIFQESFNYYFDIWSANLLTSQIHFCGAGSTSCLTTPGAGLCYVNVTVDNTVTDTSEDQCADPRTCQCLTTDRDTVCTSSNGLCLSTPTNYTLCGGCSPHQAQALVVKVFVATESLSQQLNILATIFLLWDAHMHIVQLTQTAWPWRLGMETSTCNIEYNLCWLNLLVPPWPAVPPAAGGQVLVFYIIRDLTHAGSGFRHCCRHIVLLHIRFLGMPYQEAVLLLKASCFWV